MTVIVTVTMTVIMKAKVIDAKIFTIVVTLLFVTVVVHACVVLIDHIIAVNIICAKDARNTTVPMVLQTVMILLIVEIVAH
jgi:hypothetical protein